VPIRTLVRCGAFPRVRPPLSDQFWLARKGATFGLVRLDPATTCSPFQRNSPTLRHPVEGSHRLEHRSRGFHPGPSARRNGLFRPAANHHETQARDPARHPALPHVACFERTGEFLSRLLNHALFPSLSPGLLPPRELNLPTHNRTENVDEEYVPSFGHPHLTPTLSGPHTPLRVQDTMYPACPPKLSPNPAVAAGLGASRGWWPQSPG